MSHGPTTWWPSPFGDDDQLGMLNHITDATRAAALRLARSGRLYDLGRVLDADVPAFPGRYFRQTLVTTAHHTNGGGLGANRVNWITEQVAGSRHGRRGGETLEKVLGCTVREGLARNSGREGFGTELVADAKNLSGRPRKDETARLGLRLCRA